MITITKNPKMYFTQETEDAIVAYNKEEDFIKKEQIFNDHIHEPFKKLIECIFNKFKFTYFEVGADDVQTECLTHLVINIHKYNPEKNSKKYVGQKTKAFGYFSIIAKNWLIQLSNKNYERFNSAVQVVEEYDLESNNCMQLQYEDKYHMINFPDLTLKFWEKNVTKVFVGTRELSIANAILELLRQWDRIDNFNKKSIYTYIKEITKAKTPHITKVVYQMKQYQQQIINS